MPLRNQFALLCLLLAPCFLTATASQQKGAVLSGDTPVALSTVKLFSAGSSRNASPQLLGSAHTDAKGVFTIDFTAPSSPETVLYLIADGGAASPDRLGIGPTSAFIRLASVIGPQPLADGAVINERTTVAAAYALAQFTTNAGGGFAGPSPGLQNAAAIVWNLVNPVTGEVGSMLGSYPNGLNTSTMKQFNALANMLAGCVESLLALPCDTLFSFSRPASGPAPKDTLQAALNIAHYPWKNPGKLFLQSRLTTPYKPALLLPPGAWTIALTYEGNGQEFDGPGNIAFDSHGNAWISNNYDYSPDPHELVCGGRQVLKLTPTGQDAPGAPYSGGGLYGAGFGIAVDPFDNAWVSNFRFEGMRILPKESCPAYTVAPDYNVSQFSPDGVAISPTMGYTTNVSYPQGTAADVHGSVWVANCGSDSVLKFSAGNPSSPIKFDNIGLVRPFGAATDNNGNVWVTGSGNDTLVGLSSSGVPLLSAPATNPDMMAPLGVAVDSKGNVWTADSGTLELPCNGNSGKPRANGIPSVALHTLRGKTMRTTVFGITKAGANTGGITLPWGIAIDGNDNVFVANFGGQRLSEFCGVRQSNCPVGYKTGDAISPSGTGYSSDALTRNTGVAIDQSGNVWLANNWLTVPFQTNPGGHGLVVFIGLAAPIKTPLNGAPTQP